MQKETPEVVDLTKRFSSEDLTTTLKVMKAFSEVGEFPNNLTIVARSIEWRLAELDLRAYESLQKVITEQEGVLNVFWRGQRVKKLPPSQRKTREPKPVVVVTEGEMTELLDF